MAVERNDFTEAVRKDGYSWYWESYEEIPTTYQEIFKEEDIDGAYTKEVSSSGMNDLREKGESEPIQEDTPMEGYPIIGKVRTFASKLSWSMELYDDAQVANLFKTTVQSWGDSVPRTRDRWYANFINKGAFTDGDSIFNNTIPDVVIDTSGNKIYDGFPLFTPTGTPRSSRGGGTYYNFSAVNDLDATTLQAIYTHMTTMNNRDEKDDEVIIEPDVLLVPASMKFKAEELVHYTNTASTDFMLYNNKPSDALRGKLQVVVWPRMSDSDSWILLQKKKGLVALNRMEDQIDFYRDNETKAYIATILVRFGGYVRNWRYLYGNNLPTSP